MDTSLIINLALTGFVALFILFGFLWGVIRGLRKTAFRGIWLLIAVVISLFISQLIANLIIDIEMPFLNLNVNGTPCLTLKNFIINFATAQIGADVISQVPSLTVLVQSLPVMICSPIIFALLFWLQKIIFWPLWAILAKIFIKKPTKQKSNNQTVIVQQKQDENMFANNKTQMSQLHPEKQIKKHALLGGLVGIVVGLIVCGASLVPVVGVLDIANELNSVEVSLEGTSGLGGLTLVSQENETETTTLLNQLLGEYSAYVDDVNNSVGINILKYTGINSVSLLEFNYLSTIKVDDVKISLKRELNSGLKVVQDVQYLANLDYENLTQTSLNNAIKSSLNILDNIKQSDLITLLGDEGLRFFSNGILNNEEFFVKLPDLGSEHANILLRKFVELGTTYTLADLLDDVKATINIVKVINDENLIVPLLNGDVDTGSYNAIVEHISSASDEFNTNLTDAIFEINAVSSLSPYIANAVVEMACNAIGTEVTFEPATISSDISIYKSQFSNIIENIFNLAFSLEPENDLYVSGATIENLGKLINDILKPYTDADNNKYYIVNNTTFNSLLDYGQNKLNEFVNNMEFDNNLKTTLNKIVNNIDKIFEDSNCEEEFKLYAKAFENVKPAIISLTNNESEEPINKKLETLELENIGKAFNDLQQTKLIGKDLTQIYNSLIDYAISDTTLPNLNNVLKVENPSTANINWQEELTTIKPLFMQIVKLENPTDEIFTSSSFLTKLGENLQTIKNRNINLTATTTALLNIDNVIVELINYVNEDSDFDTTIKNALTNLSTAISSNTNKNEINYKDEFVHISNLLTELNKTDFSIADAKIVINNILNGTPNANATKILDSVIFDAIIDYLPSASDYSGNNAIFNILNNTNTNITSYKNGTLTVNKKQEITNILNLVDLIDIVNELDINSATIDGTINSLSTTVENLVSNTLIFTNLKTEIISELFNIIENSLDTASDIYSVFATMKADLTSDPSLTIADIYNSINSLNNELADGLNIDLDTIDNTVISTINAKLKTIENMEGFTLTTTNKIFELVLNKISDEITAIPNSSNPLIQQQIEEYKAEKQTAINGIKADLVNVTSTNIQNDYYKTKLDSLDLDQMPSFGE